MIIYQNSLILKEYILKYLEVDEHYARNLLSNFFREKWCVEQGRWGERERRGAPNGAKHQVNRALCILSLQLLCKSDVVSK